ncbi:MAG: tryptophan synthase subunit alpha, partial [Flavobacteriales bacterium CG_4_8_14_3_um_filter_35_10]
KGAIIGSAFINYISKKGLNDLAGFIKNIKE